MRKILLIFVLILCVFYVNNYAQDYYYYKGKTIYLTPREDKIVFVLNSSNVNKELTKQTIVANEGSGAVIKEASSNVLILAVDQSEVCLFKTLSALKTANF